jgi:hypothetical protein
MTTTTYIYETSKGVNRESFTSNGYVTLERNGLHVYEHHFGSLAIKLQEQMLVNELESRNIKYTLIKN